MTGPLLVSQATYRWLVEALGEEAVAQLNLLTYPDYDDACLVADLNEQLRVRTQLEEIR